MKGFQEYINEIIRIQKNQLYFDYTKKQYKAGEVSTKFGKTKDMIPLESKTSALFGYKVYSVYMSGKDTANVLKSLKRKTPVTIKTEDYESFVKRTGLFIVSRILNKIRVDTLIAPMSSSPFLNDVIENISLRRPDIIVFTKAFKKSKPQNIKIDKDDPKITDQIRIKLQKILDNAVKDGYFEMKKVPPKFRKFLLGYMEIEKDLSMENHVTGQNVVVMDDIMTTGITLRDIFRQVSMYSPKTLKGLTIFK